MTPGMLRKLGQWRDTPLCLLPGVLAVLKPHLTAASLTCEAGDTALIISLCGFACRELASVLSRRPSRRLALSTWVKVRQLMRFAGETLRQRPQEGRGVAGDFGAQFTRKWRELPLLYNSDIYAGHDDSPWFPRRRGETSTPLDEVAELVMLLPSFMRLLPARYLQLPLHHTPRFILYQLASIMVLNHRISCVRRGGSSNSVLLSAFTRGGSNAALLPVLGRFIQALNAGAAVSAAETEQLMAGIQRHIDEQLDVDRLTAECGSPLPPLRRLVEIFAPVLLMLEGEAAPFIAKFSDSRHPPPPPPPIKVKIRIRRSESGEVTYHTDSGVDEDSPAGSPAPPVKSPFPEEPHSSAVPHTPARAPSVGSPSPAEPASPVVPLLVVPQSGTEGEVLETEDRENCIHTAVAVPPSPSPPAGYTPLPRGKLQMELPSTMETVHRYYDDDFMRTPQPLAMDLDVSTSPWESPVAQSSESTLSGTNTHEEEESCPQSQTGLTRISPSPKSPQSIPDIRAGEKRRREDEDPGSTCKRHRASPDTDSQPHEFARTLNLISDLRNGACIPSFNSPISAWPTATPGAKNSHRATPGAENSHRATPGAENSHRATPGAENSQSAMLGAEISHRATPGAENSTSATPGAEHTTGLHRRVDNLVDKLRNRVAERPYASPYFPGPPAQLTEVTECVSPRRPPGQLFPQSPAGRSAAPPVIQRSVGSLCPPVAWTPVPPFLVHTLPGYPVMTPPQPSTAAPTEAGGDKLPDYVTISDASDDEQEEDEDDCMLLFLEKAATYCSAMS